MIHDTWYIYSIHINADIFIRPLSVLSPPSWATNMSRLFLPNYLAPRLFFCWYLPKAAPRESPFFCNTHPDFVRELASSAVDRIFMPGDCVVNEGHRLWTEWDGWFGSKSKFPGGEKIKAPMGLVQFWKGGWNDEKNAGANLKYRI